MQKQLTSPLNIILLGDPAAGKATQAAFLLKKYPLYDLDMGKELRSPSLKKIPAIQNTALKGILAPTHFVREILKFRISATAKSRGILFDGTPKMIGEAKFVAKMLKEKGRSRVIVIYLTIPLAEVIKRMEKRRKIEGRADDTPAALKRRLAYYRTQIKSVVAFFSTQYPFVKISGLGSRTQVFSRLSRGLAKLDTRHEKRTH